MREKIKEVLVSVKFSDRYINLCNRFTDFDNRCKFKKKDIQEILLRMNTDLKYSSREGLFLKDYGFGDITIRIIVPYKSGMIDCTYAIWTTEFKERLNDSFFGIATLIDSEIVSKITAYKFPIATSLVELEEILKEILSLHSDFIAEYSETYCCEEE